MVMLDTCVDQLIASRDVWEDAVRSLLSDHSASASERSIRGARQFRVSTGEIINVGASGTITFQGLDSHLAAGLRAALAAKGAQVVNKCKAPANSSSTVPISSSADEQHTAGAGTVGEVANVGLKIPFADQLKGPARDAFERALLEHADELARAAKEYEKNQRVDKKDAAEYTKRIINDAKLAVRRPRAVQQFSKVDIWYDFTFLSGSVGTGVMSNMLNSAWQGMIFGASLAACLVVLGLKTASAFRRLT